MRLAPFELERYFAAHEFTATYLLSSSDCESMTIAELLGEDLHELGRVWLGYTESLGLPELRSEIASLYPGLDASHVLVHCGAQEAIHNFMQAMLAPGDHVIVHFPGYQSLYSVAEGIGCEVSRWEAHPETAWRLDFDELARLLRPTTRVVVVNSPHNPTGYHMTHDEQHRLMALAHRHGFILWSDEVYRHSEYDPKDVLPAACTLDDRAVSLGVMSKSYGLAGLRVGWIATRNQAVYESMAAYKDYTSICGSAPSEFLALAALRRRDLLLERNRDLLRANLKLAGEFMRRHRDWFEWIPPAAGPVAFPRWRDSPEVDLLCEALARQAQLMLLPGRVYGPAYASHVRLGLGRRSFPQALARFAECLGG